MVKPLSLVLVAVLAFPALAGATQDPPPPPPPPPPNTQEGPPPPAPPPPPSPPMAAVQIVPPPEESGPNVRVEVTLTEPGSGTAPKTVMVTTSSGHWGRVRTTVRSKTGGFPLNVDVRPRVTENGQILLDLRVEYRQGESSPVEDGNEARIAEASPVDFRVVEINESVHVRLQDGKPLAVTRSADADSDRSVSLEVLATVLK